MKNGLIKSRAFIILFGCAYIPFTEAQSRAIFPAVPAIADADPLTRHQVDILMPSVLSVQRTSERLSVSFERQSVRAVTISVGKNMAIGFTDEFRVYIEGATRPLQPRTVSRGSISEGDRATLLSHPNLLNKMDTLSSPEDAVPTPGKRYVIEHDILLFETNIPSQHMWQPETGTQYKVLWEEHLKTVE